MPAICRRFLQTSPPKVRTLAVVLGWERARLLFYALVGLPYVLVALLILGEGAAGVGLVDISERSFGRAEHPIVVACDSGPDTGACWP